MRLTPDERRRLEIFMAAELGRKRLERGLRLNQPEAVAIITDTVLEEARSGRTYEEVTQAGLSVLNQEQVMDGVASLVSFLQIEAQFEDGTKLITLRNPIRETEGNE